MSSPGIFDNERFVTGEAVEVDLPAAGLPLRMVSGAIDLLVIAAGFLLLVWLMPDQLFVADGAMTQVVMIAIGILIMAAVPITLETFLHGRTLGKMAMGLRTVRDDTGPIGFRHAVIRALVGAFEIWSTLGTVAVLVSMTNARGKRLGDYAAGTYVVRDRVRLNLPEPIEPSPPLARWASHADIGVIPAALVVATRQFLTRSASLSPQARAHTGTALFSALLRHVAPPPPTGAHPEDVMAAILAERRHRDAERLERADALRERLLPKV